MRTERTQAARSALALLAAALLALGSAAAPAAEEAGAQGGKLGADWQSWRAKNSGSDIPSVQRGARNFVSYCMGCHSLKYEHWSRLGHDLEIPDALLEKDLLPPGDKTTDYILTSMPAADAANWFGKTPPDLSLMARERGTDYLYQLFTTFYVDPPRPTGINNLRRAAIAMPHVLSELEGLKGGVFRTVRKSDGGSEQVLDHFVPLAPGRLSATDYAGFVRDTVNFLDYVSDPTQTARHALGVWVVLFLLVFTWLAWLMKREYWKDVH